jgi:hypothetical protein
MYFLPPLHFLGRILGKILNGFQFFCMILNLYILLQDL